MKPKFFASVVGVIIYNHAFISSLALIRKAPNPSLPLWSLLMSSCINASKHNPRYLHQLFIRFSSHGCSPGLCQTHPNSDKYAHKLPTRPSQFKTLQHSLVQVTCSVQVQASLLSMALTVYEAWRNTIGTSELNRSV